MDIIRSKLNLQDFINNDWFGYIVEVFTSEKALSIWRNYEVDTSDSDNKTATFYINDDIYMTLSYTPSKILLNLYAYGSTRELIKCTNNSYYFSCAIYRQDNYIGFNFSSSSSQKSNYSLDTNIAIDSINNDPDNIIIMAFQSATNTYLHTSILPNTATTNFYWYYNSSSSSGSSSGATTNSIQLVPFVISKIDAQCDTIYGVCISPVMNRFVAFNDEKWLLTNGIAIPCGDKINYYYVD